MLCRLWLTTFLSVRAGRSPDIDLGEMLVTVVSLCMFSGDPLVYRAWTTWSVVMLPSWIIVAGPLVCGDSVVFRLASRTRGMLEATRV